MAFPNKILPHYTYDDYVHWEGRWELIEGHPIAMSPLPVPKHQRVAADMRTEFILALRKNGCKDCRAYDPIDYKISEDTILQPDILIVCGDINKAYLDFPPELVVEILSPGTALRDRNTKFEFYQQQGIKYFLIVDIEEEVIEVYELSGTNYLLQSTERNFKFRFNEECVIAPDFSNIWK
jgi:Uma2 family endonuclease